MVTLPESYPEDAPKARFTSRVYHPLVTVKGDVDLSMRFPSWTPGQDYVILVLLFLGILVADHRGMLSVVDQEYKESGFCVSERPTQPVNSFLLCFLVDTLLCIPL